MQGKRRTVKNPRKLSAKRTKRLQGNPNVKKTDREFELVEEHMAKFDPNRWESSMTHKNQMSIFTSGVYKPDENILRNFGLNNNNDIGLFVGNANDIVTVERTKNPDERGSFGFIGVFALVSSNSTSIPGTLLLRFDHNRLGSVAPETLRLFRWDEDFQSFQKVFTSGVSNNNGVDYVWGRISLPGKYAIIGLHSHPLVIRTAKISAILSDLMYGLKPDLQKHLQERICKLILHPSELRQAIEEPEVIRALIQGSAEQGFPDPLNARKPNPGGFESPDFPDDICPDLQKPKFSQGRSLRPQPLRLPETQFFSKPEIFGIGHKAERWESVGPANIAGCIFQVVVDPVNSNTIYAASADGGLWRINDVSRYPGVAWVPLTDQNMSLKTACVAIAPSENNVLYMADGLGYLLRSRDRGLSWYRTNATKLGNGERGIYKIIVNPLNENFIFVASNSGLWRSIDGGSTWDCGIVGTTNKPVIYGDITDIAMDPANPSILYHARRKSGLWKSYRSGDEDSWNLMLDWSDADSPFGTMIKIAVGRMGSDGRMRSDADRTVAVKFDHEIFVNQKGGRPESVKGGERWLSKGKYGSFTSRPSDWCHVIAIDPFNDNVILAGAHNLFRTTNGGRTWNQVAGYNPDRTQPNIGGVHPDQQSIMFDPKQEGRVYLSNDGGVFMSDDKGDSWRDLNHNLVTAQFYKMSVSGDVTVCSMYHWGIIASTSLMRNQWSDKPGGGNGWEWANTYGDPIFPSHFYIFTDKLWLRRGVEPGSALTIIGDFTPTAIAVDTRWFSGTVLAGRGNPPRIMRALDGHSESPTWKPEPEFKEVLSGSGAPVNEAIVSIVFAPSKAGMAYAVSSIGRVFRKRDVNVDKPDGKWEEMGRWAQDNVTQLAINALHQDHLYLITSDRYAMAKNKVARSIDGGKSWVEIRGIGKDSLPDSEFNSIVAHRHDGQTIFLAADIGVFISTDEGQRWSPFDDRLPNAEIKSIFWSENYLYASTYGRGIWRRQDPLL